MKRIVVFVAVVVVGGVCGPARADDKREATYEGKPLTYWVDRLQKCEKKDRYEVCAAVVEFGPDVVPAIPALVDLLIDDRSEDFRSEICRLFCRLGPNAKSAVPALIRSLKEKKARSPANVIQVLRSIGPEAKESVPLLMALLEDPKLDTYVLEALGAIGPDAKEAVPVLIKTLETQRLRSRAVAALCSIGPGTDGLVAIRTAIRDARDNPAELLEYWDLFRSLRELGADAVPILVEYLDDSETGFRSRSIETLIAIGLPARKAIPSLIKTIHQDKDPSVRIAATRAMWQLDRNTVGAHVLLTLIAEGKETDEAAKALGEMGGAAKFALPQLEKMVNSKDTDENKRKYIQENAIDKIKADDKPAVKEQ